MTKLGDLYTDFSRIDLDTRGGYARVAQAKILGKENLPKYGAFKLMRHELEDPQGGINRFEGELNTLLEIAREENYPYVVTRIFDSGFIPSEFSEKLKKPLAQIENTQKIEEINLDLEIISTGTDFQSFLNAKKNLHKPGSNHWLPYLFVELAPYHDNLLRQIRQLSSGNISDLYSLSIREIISMGLQIIDLIDHLHKKHNFAYMDWKPEHIYWNSLKPQLKVIDWNVTNHFKNEREKKIFIREDIRLVCGAVLYCSLALNDPEDLKRPIGPKSKIAPNPLFSSEPRYWTDQPIFYDRDFMLDDSIKQIVKYGLDPRKGFETPQELKDELIKYVKKELGLSVADISPLSISQIKRSEIQNLMFDAEDAYTNFEHYRSIQLYRRVLRIEPENKTAKMLLEKITSELPENSEVDTELSREPLQLFRRARSYISAKDYQDAIRMLEDATEIAFKQGVIFREAQQLIDTLKISIETENLRRKIDISLAEEKWEFASKLYKDAISLDPQNEVFKREFDELKSLLKVKADLEGANFTKRLFSKVRPYQELITSAKYFLGTTNSLVKSVDKQLNQVQTTRIILTILLTMACIIFLPIFSWKITNVFYPVTITMPAVTESLVTSYTNTSTETLTPIIETTTAISITVSPTTTETQTPPLVTLGTGYITLGAISTWDKPNGKFVEKLYLYQAVTIFEKINDHGTDWYRCKWEINGETHEGWLLSDYITLGMPPTPRP